jgi:hypothetical protein
MKTFKTLILLLLAAPAIASAQTKVFASPDEARRAAEGVVASAAAGNLTGALKAFRDFSVLPANELDVMEAQVGTQLAPILQRFGSPTGYELVKEDKLGSSLVRYVYLVKHEKAALRWMFVFYRAERGWTGTDFRFDGNLFALFE